jgi:hypothetical protein
MGCSANVEKRRGGGEGREQRSFIKACGRSGGAAVVGPARYCWHRGSLLIQGARSSTSVLLRRGKYNRSLASHRHQEALREMAEGGGRPCKHGRRCHGNPIKDVEADVGQANQ